MSKNIWIYPVSKSKKPGLQLHQNFWKLHWNLQKLPVSHWEKSHLHRKVQVAQSKRWHASAIEFGNMMLCALFSNPSPDIYLNSIAQVHLVQNFIFLFALFLHLLQWYGSCIPVWNARSFFKYLMWRWRLNFCWNPCDRLSKSSSTPSKNSKSVTYKIFKINYIFCLLTMCVCL